MEWPKKGGHKKTACQTASPVGMPRRGVRLVGLPEADATEKPLSAFPILNFVFFIFFLLSLPPLQAKPDKEPPITPSFAKPVKSVVFSGGTVEIPLLANAPVRETKYFIRSTPARGVLGEILTTETGIASITYRHNARLGIGADSFTYAVQSPGAAVSARATVAIMVINRPARVEAPSDVDFGSVPVGSSSRRVVTLRNSGGEKFSARLQLPSLWDSELGRVEIPAGGSSDIPIIFSPDTERASSGTWFLDGGTSIKLTGAGFVVLEVSTSFLKLQEAADGSRSAKLAVRNKTDGPVEVEFVCPPGIQQIAPKAIPAGEQAMVDVVAAGKSGGRATMTIKEKRMSTTVELLIPPAPAHLVFDPSTTLDMGSIAPGTSEFREITMTNTGGTPTLVEISAPDWIRPEPSRALIKPGEQQILHLEAIGTRPGSLRDRIVFKSGDKLSELIVSASVKASAVATPVPNPSVPPPPPTLNLAETRRQALRITGIFQDMGFVTVSWQDPNPDPRTYRLESLQITSEASLARHAAIAPDVESEKFSSEEFAAERLKFTKIFERASKNDKVVKVWSPLEKLDIRDSGNATFEVAFPVPPNQQVLRIRISSVLTDGSISPIKCEIRIPLEQPPAGRWPMKTILLSLAALSAAVFLARKFKR